MTKYYVLSRELHWVGHANSPLDAALAALAMSAGRRLSNIILVNQQGFTLGIPHPDDMAFETEFLLQQLGLIGDDNDAEYSS